MICMRAFIGMEKKKRARECVWERERERDELDKNRYRNITIYNLNKI